MVTQIILRYTCKTKVKHKKAVEVMFLEQV